MGNVVYKIIGTKILKQEKRRCTDWFCVSVTLTQARSVVEEETPVEEMPP